MSALDGSTRSYRYQPEPASKGARARSTVALEASRHNQPRRNKHPRTSLAPFLAVFGRNSY